jgi:hypothetical protein
LQSAETLDSLLQSFTSRPLPLTLDEHLQQLMRKMVGAGLAALPLPGSGRTLERWRVLARVAGSDLALAKLFEGHTDALAIMAELDPKPPVVDGIWGVWAAEAPHARVRIVWQAGDEVCLQGCKAWCSGAQQIDRALLTAWDDDRQPQLVAVDLHQPSVNMRTDHWQAVGMSSTASVDVMFEHTIASCVGARGAYLARPGFWQGGGGIAACWYGAAQALAGHLHRHCSGPREDAHADAHLGAVDAALYGSAAALRDTARWIDAHPHASAERPVRRLRAQVEATAARVLEHVGRALGATPFCRDSHFARLSADLPVFLRQSHAEHDLAALGRHVGTVEAGQWSL